MSESYGPEGHKLNRNTIKEGPEPSPDRKNDIAFATLSEGELKDSDHKALTAEDDHAGESSGNNASNGTTQKLEKGEDAAAEASTAPKPPADDLQELASRGLCAPLWRTSKPAQAGVGVSDVDQLQNGWCNYGGVSSVQPVATWVAANSPVVQARLAHQQAMANKAGGYQSPAFAPEGHQLSEQAKPAGHQEEVHQKETVFSAQPPPDSLPTLVQSPFKSDDTPMPFSNTKGDLQGLNIVDDSLTASTQTKFQWPEDVCSPRQSASDGVKNTTARQGSMPRQISLPDFGELADLWTELYSMPDDCPLDLDGLPNLSREAPLVPLPSQISLDPNRQTSLARMAKREDNPGTMGTLLHDIKSQRRNRSMKFTSALTWQPGLEQPLQTRRNSGRLQMNMGVRGHLGYSDRSGSSAFQPGSEGERTHGMDLPDQVQLSIVGAPSIFSVPTCINKTFKPAFTLRVTVISSRPTNIKASVAAYTLQREQVAKLEQWHPSQHVFTESLVGAIQTETITCEGPENEKTGESFPRKHVGTGDLVFSDLKFNSSSRMKPRWLVFALALPTDDVIFVQYTVPTIVMSRQCDQTPRALAILRGEVPTRKRSRPSDSSDVSRSRTPFSMAPSLNQLPNLASPGMSSFLGSPTLAGRSGFHPQDQESMTVGNIYGADQEWPLRGPYTMAHWREAIVKVCREFGLTRSFEQEDMTELAKVAGFVSSAATGGQPSSVLLPQRWINFGKWFLSYLRIFREHKAMWMSPTLTCICGFSVTRERAEHLLIVQPEGTFLLRPSLAIESTMIISVVMNGRVCHLALDRHQLETRTLEDWVRELPEVAYLLDINTGIRYPKGQVFQRRHMLAHTPNFSGLQSNLLTSISPMGPPQGHASSLMGQSMQPQGTDALSQILEASRQGGRGALPTPGLGHMGDQAMHLGQMGMGHGSNSDLAHIFDQWPQQLSTDPFRGMPMRQEAPNAMQMHPAFHANTMRFGGR